ncbi:MAG TPA: hypothetical protein VD884_18785 [Ohtaekwangia sp.]|nr:hypothetical protein [Ohtaekwangia sp.]
MKFCLPLLLTFMFVSCSDATKNQDSPSVDIEGTWQLVSSVQIQNDSTHTDDLSGQKMIKILNKTHFSFLRHDLDSGKSASPVFVSGGGRYFFEDQKYTEHLEYCNFREWEGHEFDFEVKFIGDTLIQQGVEEIKELGVNRTIIEKYVRI